MPKALFITEKFCFNDIWHLPHRPETQSNSQFNLLNSWESTKLGPKENYFMGRDDLWTTEAIDEKILNSDADFFVISKYHRMPSVELTQKLGKKINFFWWDSMISLEGTKYWASVGGNHFTMDFEKGNWSHNLYGISVPQDPTFFYRDDSVEKTIDVLFNGSVDTHRPDRARLRDKLIAAGIDVQFSGGRGLTEEYANHPMRKYSQFYREAKICLNLNLGGNEAYCQRKGRIFEIAACGGFMLSNYPEAFKGVEGEFFTDGEDYISFTDDDIVDKIRYYLDNESERNRVANNVWTKYKLLYSPKPFWTNIMRISGLNI